MTPEELQKFNEMEMKLNQLIDVFYRTHNIDKDVFFNPVYINNGLFMKEGGTVSLGATTGTKIGATGDKVGFLGHAPVARQSAIIAPTGGATIDAESRTAIGTIINVLKLFGFTS